MKFMTRTKKEYNETFGDRTLTATTEVTKILGLSIKSTFNATIKKQDGEHVVTYNQTTALHGAFNGFGIKEALKYYERNIDAFKKTGDITCRVF